MSSRKSPTRSSPAPSKAGKPRAQARSLPADLASTITAWDAGRFPESLYLEGPDEALKAEVLSNLRQVWTHPAAKTTAAGTVRVFRAAESGPEEVLLAYQSLSLFSPRELVLVLEVEDWGRSERKLGAVATALRSGGGPSCLVLIESAAEAMRKGLESLRSAAHSRLVCDPPGRGELRLLARRRSTQSQVEFEAEAMELLLEASQGETATFFNELDKVCAWAGPGGQVRATDAKRLLRPVVGADVADYLSAVALRQSGTAAQRLARLSASGVSEGSVLFALTNLLGGALGGWARYRSLSDDVRRTWSPRRVAQGLDLLYRVERAWKSGRAEAPTLVEHATQALCAPGSEQLKLDPSE